MHNNQEKVFYVRTDANDVIATGHIMRCITIANAIAEHGCRIIFLIADENSSYLLEKTSFEYITLNSRWNLLDSETEMSQLKTLFIEDKRNGKEPILLIDSYGVTEGYCAKLHPYVKIAVLDNFCSGKYDVDLVIGYTIFFRRFNYKETYNDCKTKLLLGTKYAPLRPQFLEEKKSRKRKRDDVKTFEVLVMSGGGDTIHFLKQFLDYTISKDKALNCNYNIVVGRYFDGLHDLQKLENENIKLHINVSNMASLMAACDLAVSASGTVLYECCCMGLPTICFCASRDQVYDGQYFSKEAGLIYAGDAVRNMADTIKNVHSGIHYLISNSAARKKMSEKMLLITDGMGANRIAHEMITL